MSQEVDIDLTVEDDVHETVLDRREIYEPIIKNLVHSLGGFDHEHEYKIGDEGYGCLKDLKRLWRKDDTDDERTIARIFWETRLLPNDLVHVLRATAGRGLVMDKRAIACVDLITAMTWPIDMAEELKELDDEVDRGTDYTQLLESHRHYKAALLGPGIIKALFGVVLHPLTKPISERVERDGQIVNVILHLIRNLAFIRDLPSNTHLSSDRAEFSTLQSKLITILSETNFFDLLLALATNANNDPLYVSWNTVILEIFYLLFRGSNPSNLVPDQSTVARSQLRNLLEAENHQRKAHAANAPTRHSRFGTTISVSLNPKKEKAATGNRSEDGSAGPQSFLLHRQQAVNKDAGSIWDLTKRRGLKATKTKKTDEVGYEESLSVEAKKILQTVAKGFLQSCFNPFLSTLLKDIKSERVKITEKDNLRLLFVTKWFLEFFLAARPSKDSKGKLRGKEELGFGLVAEITERAWIAWVLRRMRNAVDQKPKLWTELQVGVECLTQLLLFIDTLAFSSRDSPNDQNLQDAADVLLQQLIYNGEVLDIAFDSLRTYNQTTQSLKYLDASVNLGYVVMRLLEKWGKSKGGSNGDGMYVRQKLKKRKNKTMVTAEGEDVEEYENEDDDEIIINETMFTFESFEAKFAHSEITKTLLHYLERSYDDFTSPEKLKRVVSLIHRQAVKAKAEGLFFNVSTLDLFRTILNEQKRFPKDQVYKELVQLLTYIVRQFFKALEENSFLAVEAFFPKNRGNWKQYSSWQPEEKKPRNSKATPDESQYPQEVAVKKGYSWSEEVGIAVGALVEEDKRDLVEWVVEILTLVATIRQRIVDETDGTLEPNDTAEPEDGTDSEKHPSTEAMAKFTDYEIPYINEYQAKVATTNPRLKLLFRLVKFYVIDDAAELQWYIPAAIPPTELERSKGIVQRFLETPFDLQGKRAAECLRKQRGKRRRRAVDSDEESAGGATTEKKRQERKKKEEAQYKSAQFIEDSDEEYGDMEAFLEREKALRERTELAAMKSGAASGTVRAHGTKKRRLEMRGKERKRKRRRNGGEESTEEINGNSGMSESESDVPEGGVEGEVTTIVKRRRRAIESYSEEE